MKKILVIFLILIITLNLVGCRKDKNQPESNGVPETGRVLDVSEKNEGEVIVVPGDVIYLDLVGEGGSGYLWAGVSPTSSDCLILKDHQVENLIEIETTSTSKWWFKIEKTCRVNLQFDYLNIDEEIKDSFKVKIISQ